MNALDKLIRYVAPGVALQRAVARGKTVQVETAVRRYEAAAQGRRTEGWRTSPTSANGETGPALRTLRDRSRDLVRNNPYAKRAVQIIGTNVVGSGIRPAPSGATKAQLKKLVAAWQRWADNTHCDFDGLRNFNGIQKAVIRAVAESGECLVLRKRLTPEETARYGGIGIQLQVLESDFLDSARDGAVGETLGSRIVQGVEFNAQGRRVAYWLYPQHPGDPFAMGYGNRQSIRIPAEDVLHVYEVLRPGQVRGVPFGVSAMLRLRDFDEYEDAQLVRQKIAACFAVFFNGTETPEGLGADGAAATENQSVIPDRVEPGMIQSMPAGSTIEMAVPPAAEGYGEYSKTVLQSVSVGYGVTYEQLTGDLSNVNFTSARMGRLEFDAYVAELQEALLIVQFCNKAFDWFMFSGFANSAVPVASVSVKWTVPSRPLVDPVKEIKALKDAVRAGFTSYSDAVLALGSNPDDMRASIKKDNDEADALKLELTSDPRKYGDNGTPVNNNPAGAVQSNL